MSDMPFASVGAGVPAHVTQARHPGSLRVSGDGGTIPKTTTANHVDAKDVLDMTTREPQFFLVSKGHTRPSWRLLAAHVDTG